MNTQLTEVTTQPNQVDPAFAYSYLTVTQFHEKHKAFTMGGLRALIFNEEMNGLAESGAIVRVGKKILIHEPTFFNHWLPSQNRSVA